VTIRIFLALFFFAVICLLLADFFYELHFIILANLGLKFGFGILLLSFALILIHAGFFSIQHLNLKIRAYFSSKQRAQRGLFFSIARNDTLQRLFRSKKKQVLYFSSLKQKRFLAKNNKKHCRLLAKSVLNELQQIKNNLSEKQFKHYQQAIKQAKVQQQTQSLLELQHEISTL